MKTYSINDWKDFDSLIDQIRKKYGFRKRRWGKSSNQLLFRGQANSEWHLTTTLERASDKPWTIESYSKTVLGCSSEIASYTEKDWRLPDHTELMKELKETFDSSIPHIPFYEYIVYLRHHSFPSPLLDWTTSPYIAAFFALADRSHYEKCCVYVYIERPEGPKGHTGDMPQITVKGPNVKTHKRHFLQKARYTIATQCKSKKKEHEFVRHDLIFESEERHIVQQDVLLKIEIETQYRMRMLDYLDYYNINYFSLFQTEDYLVKAIARKEIET